MAKILVIDDEPGIRGLLSTVLEQKGHDVLLAEDGHKGLAIFQRDRPHVIILDLKMPTLDGMAVLQRVRSVDPSVPVVVFTGASTKDLESQLEQLGATVIAKEFSLHRLGDELRRLLPASDTGPALPRRTHRAP